jgi:hypothetical protein
MIARYLFLTLAILLFAVPLIAGSDREFDAHWHDGKAEMNGYRLTVTRYGQERDGAAVLVYVTEPFSESKRVKVDDWQKDPDDTFDALKLNLIRDFQTGIYDYNTMVSVFARSMDFTPVKVTFTSSEWCGHVYEELLFYPDRIRGHCYSYFENESGPRDIGVVEGGVSEDNLFILLRGLRGDYLEPGAKKEILMLPSVYFGRLSHRTPDWVKTEIKRRKKTTTIKVPAGKFKTMVYEVKTADGRKGQFYIEDHYPHRVIRWEMSPDVKAELTGSERLQYWRLNRNGNESYLEKLGM